MTNARNCPAGRTSTRARCATCTCPRSCSTTTTRGPATRCASRRVVLVVASDRVSAYDRVLEPAIPGKGAMLTALTRWWFDQLPEVPNHLAYPLDDRLERSSCPSARRGRRPRDALPHPRHVPDRVRRARLPHRRRLEGVPGRRAPSAASRCPRGSQNGDRLPEPIYTPAWKAPLGEHDENISYERTVELVGEVVAEQLRVAVARDLRARLGDRRGARPHPRRHEVRVRRRSRHRHRDPRRRGAHERLEPLLGRRGVRAPRRRPSCAWRASTSRSCATGSPRTGTRTCPRSRRRFPHEIVEQTAERYRELLDRLTARGLTPATRCADAAVSIAAACRSSSSCDAGAARAPGRSAMSTHRAGSPYSDESTPPRSPGSSPSGRPRSRSRDAEYLASRYAAGRRRRSASRRRSVPSAATPERVDVAPRVVRRGCMGASTTAVRDLTVSVAGDCGGLPQPRRAVGRTGARPPTRSVALRPRRSGCAAMGGVWLVEAELLRVLAT